MIEYDDIRDIKTGQQNLITRIEIYHSKRIRETPYICIPLHIPSY